MRYTWIVLTLLFLSACASHTWAPCDCTSDAAQSNAGQDLFAYPAEPIDAKNRIVKDKKDDHDVRYLRFPSYGENGQPDNLVTGYYYRSKKPGAKPLVVVLPIWGTYRYPPEKVAQDLVKKHGDFNVLLIEGRNYIFDWDRMAYATTEAEFVAVMAEMADRMYTTVIDIRRLVDWAVDQEEIDPERIGVVGFSMSAVMASLAVAVDSRFASAVLVMGAADPSTAITVCPGRLLEVKNSVTRRFGWSDEQYHAIVSELFDKLDSTDMFTQIDPARILIVEAAQDKCMPAETREALWESMGRPERIKLNYKHKTAFLTMTPLGMNYTRRQIVEFLEKTL